MTEEIISGGGAGAGAAASKGKRFAAGAIDLIVIPIVLGVVIGLLLFAVPEGPRSLILILINVAWLVFRDTVFAPGRAMVGIKLVSLTGDKVTPVQALFRNVLLVVPFVLVIGYIVEIVMLASKGERLADRWAKTKVVAA